VLQDSASAELMSVFLNPCTKNFAFVVEPNEWKQCLDKVHNLAEELLATASLGPDQASEEEEGEADDSVEAAALQKWKAKRAHVVYVWETCWSHSTRTQCTSDSK